MKKNETELREVLPEGVLRDYLDLWTPTTDAPPIYHVAGALGVVATLLSNHIYLPYGGTPLYPNLWLLILGPSSSFRKSTVVSKAQSTIGGLNPDALFPEDFSRERFLEHLSKFPRGLLVSSEFGNMLALFSRDYMSGTKEMLAHLYDSPPKYTRVVKSSHLEIDQPVISFLAASQTDWFLNKVCEADMRGGFLARFLYVTATSKADSLAFPPDPDPVAKEALTEKLKNVMSVSGTVEISESARRHYEAWFRQHERELEADPKKGTLSPFWARLSSIALKLAMIFQVARDQATVVNDDTMERALKMTDAFKPSLREVTKSMVFTKEMKTRQNVVEFIQRAGINGITNRELQRASQLLKDELKKYLETLRAEGRIREEAKGQTTRYWWKADEDEIAA